MKYKHLKNVAMDKPLEFLKKYWKNNHYTNITENQEPDFNSDSFIAIRNLMSDFNIYANSEGKTDDLESGNCNLADVSVSLPNTAEIWNKAQSMNFMQFYEWLEAERQ